MATLVSSRSPGASTNIKDIILPGETSMTCCPAMCYSSNRTYLLLLKLIYVQLFMSTHVQFYSCSHSVVILSEVGLGILHTCIQHIPLTKQMSCASVHDTMNSPIQL